jgi:hypothetical protein
MIKIKVHLSIMGAHGNQSELSQGHFIATDSGRGRPVSLSGWIFIGRFVSSTDIF